LEDYLKKKVDKSFYQILQKIKDILEEELNLTPPNEKQLEEGLSISLQKEDIYDEWIEYVETLPLPEIEKIETIDHNDGPYVKIIYKLEKPEGKIVRKIKVKSDGKVNIYNYLTFDIEYNNSKIKVETEYDSYGNLIFRLSE